MLQLEFQERTNLNITPAEYVQIEKVYNEVSMNKDDFCEGYMKYQNVPFVKDLMNTIRRLSEAVLHLDSEAQDILHQKAALKEEKNQAINSADIRYQEQLQALASKLLTTNNIEESLESCIGQKALINLKLYHHIDLNDSDREFLINILK